MAAPLIPVIIKGANIIGRVAPKVARSLMNRGVATKASKKAIEKQKTASGQPIKTMSEARAMKLAKDAAPKIGGKVPGKKLPRGGRKAVVAAGVGTAAGIASVASKKSKKLPEKEVGPPPKVTALKPKGPKKKKVDSTPASTPEKTGSEYKAYPGAAGRAGFEYGRDITEVLDDKTVSDEIKEKIEEEELYEGDFKGGRVGKGKKKKVSQAPRGVRAALRGFKPKMGVSKGNKRTRGTGGGWV